MIVLDPSDLEPATSNRQRGPSVPLTTWLPPLDDTILDALASDPSFEIDWFLAAVLMSTPAVERAQIESLPLAG
jgi:hypothetical protein